MTTPPTSKYQQDGQSTPCSSFRSDSSNLEIIRATAVLSVFFAHLHDIWMEEEASLISWRFAQMGVLTFCMHTSMVLMLSLDRTKLKGGTLIGSFHLRRFFRINPFSIFCVTMAMVLHHTPEIATPILHWRWSEYLSNLALTTNFTFTDIKIGGLWILPLEVQMYLTLLFLFLLGRVQSFGVVGSSQSRSP